MKRAHNNINVAIIFFSLLISPFFTYGQEGGQENSQKKSAKEMALAASLHKENDSEQKESHNDHDHDEESGHDHEDDNADGQGDEEGNPSIGKDKGIIAKEGEGIQLSPEAIRSFELKMQDINNNTPSLPISALVKVKENQFIYRVREEWIKKIPIKIIKKNKETMIVDVLSFKPGDKIVVNGTSFLRVTEIAAEEGPSHGHSH